MTRSMCPTTVESRGQAFPSPYAFANWLKSNHNERLGDRTMILANRASLFAALFVALSRPAWSQGVVPSDLAKYTPFAIMIVDTLQYRNADAVIIRRAQLQPHDVILIKNAKATPRKLQEAVHTLEL